MQTIIFAIINTLVVYVVYYSILWSSTEQYKNSFKFKNKSINGFILKIFVSLSSCGNLIYKMIQNMSVTIMAQFNIRSKKLQRYLCNVLDIGLFTFFLFAITVVFNGTTVIIINTTGGHILELEDFKLSVANISAYIGLIRMISRGKILESIFATILVVIIKFLYYATVFGFLNNRMHATKVVEVLSSSSEKVGTNLVITNPGENDKIKKRIETGLQDSTTTLIDALAACFYRFVGLKTLGQVILILCIYSLISWLGILIGIVKVDILDIFTTIIPIQDIFNIILDMLISVLFIKIVQVGVAEPIVRSMPESKQEEVYQKAYIASEKAEAIVQQRIEESAETDILKQVDNCDTEEESQQIFESEVTHKYSRSERNNGYERATRQNTTKSKHEEPTREEEVTQVVKDWRKNIEARRMYGYQDPTDEDLNMYTELLTYACNKYQNETVIDLSRSISEKIGASGFKKYKELRKQGVSIEYACMELNI